MRMHSTWMAAALVAATSLPVAAPASASDTEAPQRSALYEIPDSELGAMRGRYIVGDNRVAWFGVTMVSDWATASGQHQMRTHLATGRAPDAPGGDGVRPRASNPGS